MTDITQVWAVETDGKTYFFDSGRHVMESIALTWSGVAMAGILLVGTQDTIRVASKTTGETLLNAYRLQEINILRRPEHF